VIRCLMVQHRGWFSPFGGQKANTPYGVSGAFPAAAFQPLTLNQMEGRSGENPGGLLYVTFAPKIKPDT
jgi:hypothetical protein